MIVKLSRQFVERYIKGRLAQQVVRAAIVCGVMAAGIAIGGGAYFMPLYAQAGYTVSSGEEGPAAPGHQEKSDNLITLSVQDSSLRWVLNAIARQAKLSLVFNEKSAPLDRPVTAKFANVAVRDAFTRVLTGTSLVATFASDGETVIIRANTAAKGSQQQAGAVMGRVIDSVGRKGVPGATVTIVELKKSAVTGERGEYFIPSIPDGSYKVSVKLLGYRTETQSVKVNGDTVRADFLMATTATALTEVVTTVTGEQRKLEIGNAIASINVDSVMQVAPVTSLTDLLATRVPGLVVQRSSGQPGDPSRLRLRGPGSVYGSNDMIVVVDGIRIDGQSSPFSATARGLGSSDMAGSGQYLASSAFDQIDPNSIETLTVFKGPSAAAMYGSDAASGVLVITTKRGRPGPSKWSVSLNGGISYIPGKYPEGYFRFGRMMGMVPARCSVPQHNETLSICDLDSIVAFQALNDPYYSVLGHGSSFGQTVTISGGSGALSYSVTGSVTEENGLLKMSPYLTERYLNMYGRSLPSWMANPDAYPTWSGTGNISSQINSDLRIKFITRIYNSDHKKTALGNNAIAVWSTKFRGDSVGQSQNDWEASLDEDRFYERVNRQSIRYTNSIELSWQLSSYLPINATAGIDELSSTDETYLPRGVCQGIFVCDSTGHYSVGRILSQTRSLNVSSQMAVLHGKITTFWGMNLLSKKNESISAEMRGLPLGVTVPTGGFTSTSLGANSQTMLGWYIEPRLNFRSRFFVMPGFRLDNNGFQGDRAGIFNLPKMNLSWVASEEEFFPWKNTVELMRVRFAFGTAGISPKSTDRLRVFNADTVTTIHPMYRHNSVISTYGNTQLRPERSTEFEGGVDLELWAGRFWVELTTYRKTQHDAIVGVPTAPSIALSSNAATTYKANIGVVRNTGAEAFIRLALLESSAYGWQSGLRFSQNANRVVRLNAGDLSVGIDEVSGRGGSVRRVIPGYPLWGLWARPIVGVYDLDNNNIITKDEVVLADSFAYLGQPEPKGSMTFSNDWMLFNGRLGIHTGMSYQYGLTQTAEVMRDFSSPLNMAANDPSSTPMQQAIAVVADESAYGITQTVNTFRFETLSINLNLGERVAKRFYARAMSVALQGSNLGMKSNYLGKDPNVNSAAMGDGSTVDVGLLSQPRRWTLRLTLGN